MFSPTSFPCEAWTITPSFNVRPVVVQSNHRSYRDRFWTDRGLRYNTDLFHSREEAIQEACRKLALAQERHRKAGLNLERRAAAVERLVKGDV